MTAPAVTIFSSRTSGFQPPLVPEIERHQGPQLIAEIALAVAMRLQQLGDVLSADDALRSESPIQKNRPRPIAQPPLEQFHHGSPEALLRPIDDRIRQQTFDGLLEKPLHR